MTTPGPQDQWPQQWQQPQQQPQPQWQQPPQQQWQQPQQAWPQQQPYYPQPGYPAPRPPSRSRRGLIIGLVVALVVLAGGGATWIALSQSDNGSATPTEAALKLASSLGNADVVGVLGSLAPAEASMFTDPVQAVTDELKRLNVLDASADPEKLSGVQISTANLTFDEAGAEQVNDHVTITKLTGGTITVTGDASRLPLAKDFLDAVPGGVDRSGPRTETIDIGKQVRQNGEPIRIATVQVDGEWYPSLLYTIADYALRDAGEKWPSTSIPANGAGSANDAVKETVQAVLDADVRRVIELMPPEEMAVLHDAGPAIVDALGPDAEPSGAKVIDLQTQSTDVDGGTRATLTSLVVQGPDGETYAFKKNGACYDATIEGDTRSMCADDLAGQIEDETGSLLPGAVTQVLQHLSTGVLAQGLGVIVTESGGKYYVSPLRTLVEQGVTLLRALQPGDITALLHAAG
ncbi:flagellar basal body protein FliL [Amycolatopsis sp.]|uniref:flagellar basal body protein FliL n=1 Tax=Amycolatopsis sp. TaxID=37632 RepID=UPI002C0FB388|nr:flagellar basal body protein FliL [Amycolatopsis sp.]HVV10633.1 flagellar basal body protein FliL [Amycolatopsis sp.]